MRRTLLPGRDGAVRAHDRGGHRSARHLPGERLRRRGAAGQQLLAAVQQQHDLPGNERELRRERSHRGQREHVGLAAADVLRLSTNVPAGALLAGSITAPAGDTISAISMDRDLYEQGEGWLPQIVDAEGSRFPGETCPFDADNGGCEVSGAATHTGLDTTSLAIELLCDPEPFQLTRLANGFSEHDARVELNSATVTITDEQPPQITSTSGSLFAGGLVRGTLSGTIDGVGQQRRAVRPRLRRRRPGRPAAVLVRLHADRAVPGQLEQPVQPRHEHALRRPASDPGGRGRCRRQPDARQPRPGHRR